MKVLLLSALGFVVGAAGGCYVALVVLTPVQWRASMKTCETLLARQRANQCEGTIEELLAKP